MPDNHGSIPQKLVSLVCLFFLRKDLAEYGLIHAKVIMADKAEISLTLTKNRVEVRF